MKLLDALRSLLGHRVSATPATPRHPAPPRDDVKVVRAEDLAPEMFDAAAVAARANEDLRKFAKDARAAGWDVPDDWVPSIEETKRSVEKVRAGLYETAKRHGNVTITLGTKKKEPRP